MYKMRHKEYSPNMKIYLVYLEIEYEGPVIDEDTKAFNNKINAEEYKSYITNKYKDKFSEWMILEIELI